MVHRMKRTRWWEYVERLMSEHEWSKADLSRAADVDQSVIGRWQNQGAAPEPRTVRAVAAAFGRDVREAAIAAELFTAEELTSGSAPVIDPDTFDLSIIPDERLRDEVYARMRRPRATGRPRAGRPGREAVRPGRTRPASFEPSGGHEATEIPPSGQAAPPLPHGSEVNGEANSHP